MSTAKKAFQRHGGRSQPITKAEMEHLQSQSAIPAAQMHLRPGGRAVYEVHSALENQRQKRIQEIQTKLSGAQEKFQSHYKKSTNQDRGR